MANQKKDKEKDKSTFKLTCIITGKSVVINKDYYEKKVIEAGDEQTLIETYCCKQAKSLLKRGYSINEIRKLLNATEVATEVTDATIRKIVSNNKDVITAFDNVSSFSAIQTDADVKAYINTLKQYE